MVYHLALALAHYYFVTDYPGELNLMGGVNPKVKCLKTIIRRVLAFDWG